MIIEQAVVAMLLANSAVTTLIGTRIFPVAIRQDVTFPSLVYLRLGGERQYTLAGRAGWGNTVIGINCWAREYATARSLADAVRNCLDAQSDGTSTGVQVAAVNDVSDIYDADLDVYGCGVSVQVQYLEA
ncbi:MAG: DUF3168 domain-containing protein [Caldilineaceae bacterium]|nr:DUF3168 domain-containing protein [Caldilineaceae bacterium]